MQDEPQATRNRLFEWIAGWLPARPSPERLASLDLLDFVRESAHLELDGGERLRLLAVYAKRSAPRLANEARA